MPQRCRTGVFERITTTYCIQSLRFLHKSFSIHTLGRWTWTGGTCASLKLHHPQRQYGATTKAVLNPGCPWHELTAATQHTGKKQGRHVFLPVVKQVYEYVNQTTHFIPPAIQLCAYTTSTLCYLYGLCVGSDVPYSCKQQKRFGSRARQQASTTTFLRNRCTKALPRPHPESKSTVGLCGTCCE